MAFSHKVKQLLAKLSNKIDGEHLEMKIKTGGLQDVSGDHSFLDGQSSPRPAATTGTCGEAERIVPACLAVSDVPMRQAVAVPTAGRSSIEHPKEVSSLTSDGPALPGTDAVEPSRGCDEDARPEATADDSSRQADCSGTEAAFGQDSPLPQPRRLGGGLTLRRWLSSGTAVRTEPTPAPWPTRYPQVDSQQPDATSPEIVQYRPHAQQHQGAARSEMRSAHSGSCLPQLQLDEPAAASSGAEPNTGNSSIFNGLHTPGHPQESILGYGCTTAASSKEGGSGGNATLTSPAAADTAGRAAAGPAHQPPQQQAPLWPMPPPQQPPRRTSAFGRNKTTRIGLLTTNFNDPRPSLLSPPSLASPNDAASDAGPCSSLSIATSSIHQSMLFSPYSPGSSIPASAATPALSSYDVGSAAACFGSGASAAAAAAGVKCSSKATAAAVPRTAADGRVTLATLLASPATSPAPSPRTSATSTKPSEVLRQGTPAAVDVTAVEEAMEDISAAGGVAPLRTVKTNNAARTTAPATPAAPSAAAPLSPLPSLVSQQPSPAVEAAAAAAPPTPSAATAAARPAVAGGDWTELPEREHPFMADLRKVEAVLFVASPKAAAPAAPAPAAAAPAPSSGGSTGSVHPWVLEVEEGAAVRSSAPASSGCGRRAPEVTSPHACAATSQDSPAPPASATPPLPPPSPALAPPRQQPQSSPAPQQPQSLASPLPRATQAARRPSASPAAAVAPPAAAAASPAAAAAAPPRPLMRPLLPPRVLPEDRSLYVSEGAPAEMLQNARAAVAGQRVAWSLADFEILKTLHEGYASSVFRARCLVSGALVVLKVYNLEDQTSFLRYQMLRELHIHARLRHQNIVPLFGSFRDDCALVMVQQYVHGGSLSQLRRGLACGRMTEFQVMHLVVIPLLNALVYLHRHGIVHRDIKPANLLFTSDWQLKLCDFGVSICLHEERAVTRTGSADYMAPEVTVCPLKHLPEDHKGNASMAYTSAVDVWSVGVLVYDMLVGFTPFPSGMSRVRATAGDSEPADKLHFPSSVGEPARAFVRACLRLNPADRPTVQELRRHEWVTKALDDVS